MTNSQTSQGQLQLIRSHYPEAVPADVFSLSLYQLVQARFGIQPGQVLSAHSFCSDEINAVQFPQEARASYGPFQLGGLDGFPFAGLTGLNAFAHHVMEQGALAITFGPHIGITANGEVGLVERVGQSNASTCCGAASAALSKLQSGSINSGEVSELDYQQNTLEQLLLRAGERVLGAESPIREATEVVFEASHARLKELLELAQPTAKHTIIVGLIVINSTKMYCALRSLVVRNADGTEHDLTQDAQALCESQLDGE